MRFAGRSTAPSNKIAHHTAYRVRRGDNLDPWRAATA
jgi:hypothetical protein